MDSYSKCPFQYRYLLVSYYVCFLIAVSGFIFRPLIHLELSRSFMCAHLVLSVSFADDVISSLASASDIFVKYKMTVVICTCLVLWFCFTDPCVCFFYQDHIAFVTFASVTGLKIQNGALWRLFWIMGSFVVPNELEKRVFFPHFCEEWDKDFDLYYLTV